MIMREMLAAAWRVANNLKVLIALVWAVNAGILAALLASFQSLTELGPYLELYYHYDSLGARVRDLWRAWEVDKFMDLICYCETRFHLMRALMWGLGTMAVLLALALTKLLLAMSAEASEPAVFVAQRPKPRSAERPTPKPAERVPPKSASESESAAAPRLRGKRGKGGKTH